MNRATRILGLAVALAIATGPLGGAKAAGDAVPQPVSLKPVIVVEGSTVTLGDLFTGVGEKGETPIARSPAPGEEVRLPARWLARVARAYQVDWSPRSHLQEAALRRASQRIDSRQIEAALVERVDYEGVERNFEILLDNPEIGMNLPVDVSSTVEIAGFNYDRDNGRFNATAMAPGVSHPEASVKVTGRVVELRRMPVTNRRIGRGEIITESDLRLVDMPVRDIGRSHLTSSDAIIGLSARSPIREGQALRDTDLEPPTLVSKNSLVTLAVKTSRMRLTAQGRALEDGSKGDTIRVINTNSNTVVTGVVQASGSVTVNPGSAVTN